MTAAPLKPVPTRPATAAARAKALAPRAPLQVARVVPAPISTSRRPPAAVVKTAPARPGVTLLPSRPVRHAPGQILSPRPAATVKPAASAKRSLSTPVAVSPLHDGKTTPSRSDPPRKDRLPMCKPRPTNNKPSGGGSRPFVPWCK